MASFMDFFNGTASPEQSASLAGFASQFNNALGDGRRPVNLAAAFAAGAQGMQQGRNEYQDRQRDLQMLALQSRLMNYKLQDAESDLQNQQTARERVKQLAAFNKKYFSGGADPEGQAPASRMGAGVFTSAAEAQGLPTDNGTLNQIVDGVNSGMAPEQVAASLKRAATVASLPQKGGIGPQKQSIFDQRVAYAQALRGQGFAEQADAAEATALKFQPKVKDWKQVQSNGQVLYVPLFEDGTNGTPVPYEAAIELDRANTGGSTDLYNPITGNTVRSMRNTQSPDNAATVGASYANAAATRDVAAATRAAAEIQRNQATEMKLGDDYRTQSKDFKEVGNAYRQINATLDKATTSPAATLAAATKFMKLLDPGSVVRESELGMALAASGVFDRATNYYQTLLRGRVLTPTQVADFKKIKEQIYGAAQAGQQSIDQSYRQQAKTYGLRPEMIVQDLGQNVKPTRTDTPMKGQVVKGYRFKGGDPSDQNNWERQ